jgi:hypothetical protein
MAEQEHEEVTIIFPAPMTMEEFFLTRTVSGLRSSGRSLSASAWCGS